MLRSVWWWFVKRAAQARFLSQMIWGMEANSTACSRFWEVIMSRIYMSGTSLWAIKQRYTLIYFDGGKYFLGATDKSPESLGDAISGPSRREKEESPQSSSIFYISTAASRKYCVFVWNVCDTKNEVVTLVVQLASMGLISHRKLLIKIRSGCRR